MKVLCAKLDPIGKPRMVQSDRWKKRPSVERFWEWKDEIKRVAKEQAFNPLYANVDMINGGLKTFTDPTICGEFKRLMMIFHLPMPKSWSKKKKREAVFTVCDKKPDIDNLQKSVLDAIWRRDEYLSQVIAAKYWAYSPMILIVGEEPNEQMQFLWDSGEYPRIQNNSTGQQCSILFPGCEEEEGCRADLGAVQVLWSNSRNPPRLHYQGGLPPDSGLGVSNGVLSSEGWSTEGVARIHGPQGSIDLTE